MGKLKNKFDNAKCPESVALIFIVIASKIEFSI